MALRKGRAPRRDRSIALRICTILMLLACIVAGIGIGWLTTKGNLEAAQIKGGNLKVENEQYASALKEANRQVEIANASIEELKQRLAKSEKFGAHWWEIAHPKEFESLDALKTWLAKYNTVRRRPPFLLNGGPPPSPSPSSSLKRCCVCHD